MCQHRTCALSSSETIQSAVLHRIFVRQQAAALTGDGSTRQRRRRRHAGSALQQRGKGAIGRPACCSCSRCRCSGTRGAHGILVQVKRELWIAANCMWCRCHSAQGSFRRCPPPLPLPPHPIGGWQLRSPFRQCPPPSCESSSAQPQQARHPAPAKVARRPRARAAARSMAAGVCGH